MRKSITMPLKTSQWVQQITLGTSTQGGTKNIPVAQVSEKCLHITDSNFVKCWPIFKIFSTWENQMSLAVLSRAACASMSTTTTTTTRDRGDRYGPIEWAQSAAICNEVIYKSTSQFKMCCCTNVQNICHFFNLQMTNIFAPALSFIASRPSCPVSCDFHATKTKQHY